MGEYLSALSNSALSAGQSHGYLCFGIEKATHRLVGTRVDPSTLKVGAEPIEPWFARMLEPRIDFAIRTATIEGLQIVIFEVDAARSRPVAFSGLEYIRIGSHKKKLKDYPDREAKIWSKARGIVFEDGIAAPDLDEEKILSLLDIGGFFDLFGQTIPDRAYTLDLLERERLLKKGKGQVSITKLGAILVAKDLSQFPHLARKAVRVIQYRGKVRTDAIAEQEGRKGYASGYQGLISALGVPGKARNPENWQISLRRSVRV